MKLKLIEKLFSLTHAASATSRGTESETLISNEAGPAEATSQPRWRTIAICLGLAAMVWAVFGQTLHFDFINYDDPAYVYQNPVITQGLSLAGLGWVFSHVNVGTWFPLTDVSHQLDWQLYGANAGGHHLTNVVLHAGTAILLFLALRKLTGWVWPATFATAVFAIHPLRVESVAWVVERKDVLSGLFFMLTLCAWARYVQKRDQDADRGRFASDPRSWTLDYYLALAFFALGLLSKSMLVTLPFVLLLLDYWPLDRQASGVPHSRLRAWLSLIVEKVPFLLLSAAICVITIRTQKNAVVIAQSSTFFWRIGNAMLAYTDYLEHMVYPVGLTVAYAHSGTNPSLWNVGLSALILVAISAGVLIARRKHPCLLVGWLWYLGMFLPVIDIMQAGQNARADRYTYLPQIGLYIMITWGAAEVCAHWRHRRVVLGFGAVAILAGLLAGAYVQTGYWKDSVTLWTRALACKSDYSFVHNTLGSALFNQGKSAEAILHFERALQFEPDNPEAHVNLGIALATQGKQEEAIQQYEQALHFNPYSSAAHYNLGDMLATQGKQEEAIHHFERALQLRPDYADAHYDLGLALASQGKWSEAIQHFEPVLHIKLDDTDARYILGVALSTHQKWVEAIELYERVLQVKPDFAEAHNCLGIALASQGKLAEARTQFQKALTLATAQGNTPLAESIRTRLKSSTSASPPSQNP